MHHTESIINIQKTTSIFFNEPHGLMAALSFLQAHSVIHPCGSLHIPNSIQHDFNISKTFVEFHLHQSFWSGPALIKRVLFEDSGYRWQ